MPLRSLISKQDKKLCSVFGGLLIALLVMSTGALAVQLPAPGINNTDHAVIEKPHLSEKMQVLLAKITTPEEALDEARIYQENGQFGLAKIVLQYGIDLSSSSGGDSSELTNELEYSMPLLQVRELMVNGEPDQAEAILKSLDQQFGADYKRSTEINALLSAMSQSRMLALAKRNNEREVTKAVRGKMRQYYQQNGFFPHFSKLNRILPPEDDVLQNYEIVYYKELPNAYRMVLRNLHSTDNFLKIEATGLIK